MMPKDKVKPALLLLCLLLGVASGYAQKPQNVKYKEFQAGKSGDERYLELSLKMDVSDVRLGSRDLLFVDFLLRSENGETEKIAPIVIAGANRYKVLKRKNALGNRLDVDVPFTSVIPLKSYEDGVIPVFLKVPLKSWMSHSQLEARSVLQGCAECLKERSGYWVVGEVGLFSVRPEDLEWEYLYSDIPPVPKERALQTDCRLQFVLNKHDIRQELGDNARELSALDEFLHNASQVDGMSCEDLTIVGYASPEGNYERNRTLAKQRAEALLIYIKERHAAFASRIRMRVNVVGEDWNGLRIAVAKSSLEKKEQVIAAIDQYKRDTEREAAIRRIDGGKSYRILLLDFYPQLRRSTIVVKYTERYYAPEADMDMFRLHKDDLSYGELSRLAQRQRLAGHDTTEIYEYISRKFPDKQIALINYATSLMHHRGEGKKALSLLLPLSDKEEAYYPIACAYVLEGDMSRAEIYMKKAASTGSGAAKSVLKKIK